MARSGAVGLGGTILSLVVGEGGDLEVGAVEAVIEEIVVVLVAVTSAEIVVVRVVVVLGCTVVRVVEVLLRGGGG